MRLEGVDTGSDLAARSLAQHLKRVLLVGHERERTLARLKDDQPPCTTPAPELVGLGFLARCTSPEKGNADKIASRDRRERRTAPGTDQGYGRRVRKIDDPPTDHR
jgi:hypothetical protein